MTNIIDKHNVRYMRANLDEELGRTANPTTVVLAVLLIVFIFVALLFGILACRQNRPEVAKSAVA